jgi:hypothetical protein
LIDTEMPKRVSDEDELHLVLFMSVSDRRPNARPVIEMYIDNENYGHGFAVGNIPNLKLF